MNTTPLVSVLMTAYNREKYIAEAIESVIVSTYQNWELIIVDDGSKDRTVEIAKSYEAKDDRIKVYMNVTNLGDYPNRNMAASYAKGKYIKYLDSDDLIYPHGLQVMIEAMENFPEAGFALSHSFLQFNEPYPRLLYPKEVFIEHFLNKALLNPGPTASIIKKSAFIEVGCFSVERHFGDTDMWYKLATTYPLILLMPGLIWWREHPQQEMVTELENFEFINLRFHHTIKVLSSQNIPLSITEKRAAINKVKQNHSRRLWSLLFRKRQFKVALILLKKSELSLFELLKGLKKYS